MIKLIALQGHNALKALLHRLSSLPKEATKLCLSFLPLSLCHFFKQLITNEYITPALFLTIMQSSSNWFQTTYGSGLMD